MNETPYYPVKTKCLFGDFLSDTREAALEHVTEIHRLSPNLAGGYVVPVDEVLGQGAE